MSISEMSQSTTASLRSARHPAFAGMKLLERARERVADFMARLERRRAENELLTLDDRMLKDIGIDRGGIKWAVMAERRDRERRTGSRFSD